MVFSNLFFIYAFLPLCAALYFISPSIKVKNTVLLCFSLVFYALGEPIYVLVLLAASLSAFLFAGPIERNRGRSRGKLLLTLSVVINISFLFVFKYVPLLAETFGAVTGMDMSGFPVISLPIGVSFYTFQILTYTIDVYFGKIPVQKSPARFMLYVSLFPQLIAGPIVRYADVEKQLGERSVSADKLASGVLTFVCGLSKKVLLADAAGEAAGVFLKDALASGTLGAWLGIVLFAFQIYFDFGGYSDMAIGLGRMFGFEFLPNFNYPYISQSLTEFWRRWHMSLGTFFRDYVYIPLGGNRRAHIRNILVVWFLTGLWHGASWNFALWGLYYGLWLIIEKYALQKFKLPIPRAVKAILSFAAVLVGWVLFYYTDVNEIGRAFTAMFSYHRTSAAMSAVAADNIVILLICVIAATPLPKKLYMSALAAIRYQKARMTVNTALSCLYAAGGLFICTAKLVGSSFSPFLYFRF